MNDIHGIKQQKQQSTDDTHSLKINRMHGISLTSLNANDMRDMGHSNNGDLVNGNQSAIIAMDEMREQQHDAAVTESIVMMA